MTTTKATEIKLIAGYYEFHLFINGELIYCLDGDCSEDWFNYEDSRVYAEFCVDSILDELKQDERYTDYEMIATNKDDVIKCIAEFVADWTE